MENHTMFSSLQETSSFPYETERIQGNGNFEISASACRHLHEHRHRHSNTTIAFYMDSVAFRVNAVNFCETRCFQ